MTMLRWLRNRLMARQIEREIVEELRTHMRLRAEEYERAGLSPREAVAAVRRRFGDADCVLEACRSAHRLPAHTGSRARFVDSVTQDLRYAVRTLVARPGFTLTAVATLMLGIGANTAIFSVLNSVLLNPLPFPGADHIRFLWLRQADQGVMITPDMATCEREVSRPPPSRWRPRPPGRGCIGAGKSPSNCKSGS